MIRIDAERPGFLLLEVLLGIAVFGIFLAGVGTTLLYGQENTIMGGDRMRAAYFSSQALEAARSLRDADFDALLPGQHGMQLNVDGEWELTDAPVTHSGGYTTSLEIAQSGANTVVLSANTTWKHGYNRSGSVLLTTHITHWTKSKAPGNWSSMSEEGSYEDGGTPMFNRIAISGDYAFVTSDVSGGGAGLYVFDISGANPTLASTVSLGNAAYGILVHAARLYVAVADSTAEIQAYDITDPSTLNASDLVTSMDVEGDGRVRALAAGDDTLFAGAVYSALAGEEEFYSYDISDADNITELDAYDVAGTVSAIALSGTSAILASGEDIAEIRFLDVEDPQNITFNSAEAYQASGNEDALSVDVAGNLLGIGREYGSSVEEFMLLNLGDGDGFKAPPPGPWFYNPGSIATPASVLDVHIDPTGCYGFLITDDATQEVQVLKVADTLLPKLGYMDVDTGFGRSAAYDIVRDRLYLLTDTALHVLQPAAGSSSCS